VSRFKDVLRGRTVTEADIIRWRESLCRLLEVLKQEFTRRQAEMLDPLHDPIRLAKQLRVITTTLAQRHLPGRTLDEQLERADPEWISLVKAAELLDESFGLLTIYFNPEAATFGRRTYLSLHGLLTKLVRILTLRQPTDTNDRTPRVFINGESYRQVLAYESFRLIPLALISNAIKYCLEGVVRVDLVERPEGVEVSVESVGPAMEQDEIPRLFDKRVRGRWAEKVASGSGVGLYLAKVIADAHGVTIRVSSVRHGGRKSGEIPIATNRFSFTMPYGSADQKLT
jgi:signal transduction histidine kinase